MFCYTSRISVTPYESAWEYRSVSVSATNDEVQHFRCQEPCLSPPTITLMKTNTSTSEEDYDGGEIEPYKNDCLEKFAESNQSQN